MKKLTLIIIVLMLLTACPKKEKEIQIVKVNTNKILSLTEKLTHISNEGIKSRKLSQKQFDELSLSILRFSNAVEMHKTTLLQAEKQSMSEGAIPRSSIQRLDNIWNTEVAKAFVGLNTTLFRLAPVQDENVKQILRDIRLSMTAISNTSNSLPKTLKASSIPPP